MRKSAENGAVAMDEIWKDVVGYEGSYKVSNLGRIKSNIYTIPRLMNPTDNGNGYMIIGLWKDSKRKNHYVHRLVAEAFVENPKGYKYVNHLDQNKMNNNASNLEWCTQRENVLYSVERMRHRKTVSHTNTGEMYICYRKKCRRYRITIDNKEYPSAKTLEEAIQRRNEILKGVVR